MSIEEIIGLILYIAPGFLTMEVYITKDVKRIEFLKGETISIQ